MILTKLCKMIDPTTEAALRRRMTSTQCALAKELGEPVATLSDILALRHSHVSLKTENRVRQKLGLAKLRPPVELLPDEKIVKLRPPHKRDKRRCIHAEEAVYALFEAERKARRLTQNQFLSDLLTQSLYGDE